MFLKIVVPQNGGWPPLNKGAVAPFEKLPHPPRSSADMLKTAHKNCVPKRATKLWAERPEETHTLMVAPASMERGSAKYTIGTYLVLPRAVTECICSHKSLNLECLINITWLQPQPGHRLSGGCGGLGHPSVPEGCHKREIILSRPGSCVQSGNRWLVFGGC